jgi:hypothetical protein
MIVDMLSIRSPSPSILASLDTRYRAKLARDPERTVVWPLRRFLCSSRIVFSLERRYRDVTRSQHVDSGNTR